MDTAELFWANTNNLIKARKTTQRTLALECGFTTRHIESLSTSLRIPRADEALIMAEALGTSVEWLLTGKEQNSIFTTDEIEFLDKFRELDEGDKAVILSTLNSLHARYAKSTGVAKTSDA